MIIDCHGHYTTAPKAHVEWRQAQLAGDTRPYPSISDDELRDTIEQNQLSLTRARGTDMTLFSPRASAMAHHQGGAAMNAAWARACNDLIARVVELYPEVYAGVAQLPQSIDRPISDVLAEVRRVIEDLGFVGVILNPDPSGGRWESPRLTDEYWFPLYELLQDLGAPAMIHPSAAGNRVFHGTGDHYLNADTTAFMQLVEGSLFTSFPGLQLVIPHGGGAVPYHWGRYRGLADMLGQPPIESNVMGNVYFDTCVYHQAGIDLLLKTVAIDNILFGSELLGAVRGIDSDTGNYFDDTRRYIDAAQITACDRQKVYEDNARRVFPRLDQILSKQGR